MNEFYSYSNEASNVESFTATPPTIVSVSVTETRVEIVKRQISNATYAVYPPRPVPDFVWKEIYEIVNGTLVRQPDVAGTHAPAQLVPESILWENNK